MNNMPKPLRRSSYEYQFYITDPITSFQHETLLDGGWSNKSINTSSLSILCYYFYSFIHSFISDSRSWIRIEPLLDCIDPLSYTRSLPYHLFSILPIPLKPLQSHSNSTTIHFPLQPDSLLINNPLHFAIHSTNTHIKQGLYHSLLSTPWTLACCSSCHYSSLHAW